MAWLNIDRDLEYDPSTLKIIDCDMPFIEGSRKMAMVRGDFWSFRNYHRLRYRNKTIWSYLHMVLTNSIGKPFDVVFSNYCHVVSIQYQHDFLDEFRPRWRNNEPDYYVDDQGLIRKTIHEIPQWIRDYREKNKPTKLYTFTSAGYKTEKIHKQSGRTYEDLQKENPYKRMFVRSEKHSFITVVKSGYTVENVQPKSNLEKRLKAEKRQKEKQREKIEKEQRKLKKYNFKTQQEIEAKLLLKKLKLENDNNILRHGFNDESFKGEHYHGRKNKKNGNNNIIKHSKTS